jgi:hypothetical protein
MGVGVQLHVPAALPPEKRPGTHCLYLQYLWYRHMPLQLVLQFRGPTTSRSAHCDPLAQSPMCLTYTGLRRTKDVPLTL